jgi:peptidoglycan/LPS O-acetylase OafA/YrhL
MPQIMKDGQSPSAGIFSQDFADARGIGGGNGTLKTVMHRGLSLYFDLLRLAAALEVFVYHLAGLPKTGVEDGIWNAFGHEAVTIFFVLSGFVIPYAARSREPDPRAFAVARLTRVYSVAIPCLVLTLMFDWIGHHFDPAIYRGLTPPGSALVSLGIGAAMLNEAWLSVQMLSNTPYWSISYEFWYYVVFATLFYLRGRRRLIATLVAMLIAGPNIMLLFPIWGAGWLAYRERFTASWPKALIWVSFAQPLIVFATYQYFDFQGCAGQWMESWLGHEIWWKHLAWSRYLLSDGALGISVALNLAAAKRLGPQLDSALGWLVHPIRWGAARSFTLYLLHQPAILVVTALLSATLPQPFRGLTIAVISLAIVAIVAQLTEMRRNSLKPVMVRVVDLVGKAWPTSPRTASL